MRCVVDVPGIWYAGSHGFDIVGPGGDRSEYQDGTEYLPVLDDAEKAQHEALDAIPDCLVFDLDPADGDFAPVRQAGRRVVALMQRLDMSPYVTTTGPRALPGASAATPIDLDELDDDGLDPRR